MSQPSIQDKLFKRRLAAVIQSDVGYGLQLNIILITRRRVSVLKRVVSSRRDDLAERAYRNFHGYRGGMNVRCLQSLAFLKTERHLQARNFENVVKDLFAAQNAQHL
jgi:hypothetical protein